MTFISPSTRIPPPRFVCLGTPLATCALPTGVFYFLLESSRDGVTSGQSVGPDGNVAGPLVYNWKLELPYKLVGPPEVFISDSVLGPRPRSFASATNWRVQVGNVSKFPSSSPTKRPHKLLAGRVNRTSKEGRLGRGEVATASEVPERGKACSRSQPGDNGGRALHPLAEHPLGRIDIRALVYARTCIPTCTTRYTYRLHHAISRSECFQASCIGTQLQLKASLSLHCVPNRGLPFLVEMIVMKTARHEGRCMMNHFAKR